MKLLISTAVIAASLATASVVMADRSKYDTDGDGALSLAEIQAHRPGLTAEKFALMDINGDGVLSREENPRGRRKGPKMDTNGDGSIDLLELQAARPNMTSEKFAKLDTNNDGLLTKDERPRRKSKAEKFSKLDVDGSGGVSFAEIQSAKQKKAAERFERMDVDGSGEVSLEEFEAQSRGKHRDHKKMHRGERENRLDQETS